MAAREILLPDGVVKEDTQARTIVHAGFFFTETAQAAGGITIIAPDRNVFIGVM